MDKEQFRKIESRLYKYYRDIKLIEKLKRKVVLLYKQVEAISKEKVELKHMSLDTYTNLGVDYSREKIQSSSTGTSEAERETIKYIDKLEKERINKIKKMQKTNCRIRTIEEEQEDMRSNIEMLNEENKRFLEWKYGEQKSMDWIAIEMFQGARTTAYRKREEIIQDLGQWSYFKKSGTKVVQSWDF
ncbi:hypothetical protein [Inconstantimicrobium mannanitabidum]|uniref:Uncharacterized protein n=1 Tax=Inconstantimicrobium mannanitabidum TaxID=1604901 RepID=A0ACB5R8W1_9CLOT|nr:hypothetical protein [Clostridium sp. TW13]GKX65633.1 hypothetical protein rsdtw13_08910 [Clostridium sp. TW13]